MIGITQFYWEWYIDFFYGNFIEGGDSSEEEIEELYGMFGDVEFMIQVD